MLDRKENIKLITRGGRKTYCVVNQTGVLFTGQYNNCISFINEANEQESNLELSSVDL